MTIQVIVFVVVALFVALCPVVAVTTSCIMRTAPYMLLVIFCTAGLYFQLNDSFLRAIQLLFYAGSIAVIYIFRILLTSTQRDEA